jgi:hypothetical protein
MDIYQSYRKGWRSVSGSVIFLLFAISFSLAQVIKILNMEAFAEGICETLDIMFKITFDDTFDWSWILDAIPVTMVLPGVLMAAGFWMIYIDSYKNTAKPIATVGLRLAQIGIGLMLAVYILIETVVVAFLINMMGLDLGNGYADVYGEYLLRAVLVFTVIEIAAVIYMRALSVSVMAAQECEPRGTTVLVVAGVLAFLSCAGILVSSMIEEVDLSELYVGFEYFSFTLMTAVAAAMLGVAMFLLKNAMKREDEKRVKHYNSLYYRQNDD